MYMGNTKSAAEEGLSVSLLYSSVGAGNFSFLYIDTEGQDESGGAGQSLAS